MVKHTLSEGETKCNLYAIMTRNIWVVISKDNVMKILMDELCISCFSGKNTVEKNLFMTEFFIWVRKVAVLLYALGSQINIYTCPMLMQSYPFVKINSKM